MTTQLHEICLLSYLTVPTSGVKLANNFKNKLPPWRASHEPRPLTISAPPFHEINERPHLQRQMPGVRVQRVHTLLGETVIRQQTL